MLNRSLSFCIVFYCHVLFCCLVFPGRETPSVAGIITPGAEGFQKLFFGQEEIAIPVHSTYVSFFLTPALFLR